VIFLLVLFKLDKENIIEMGKEIMLTGRILFEHIFVEIKIVSN